MIIAPAPTRYPLISEIKELYLKATTEVNIKWNGGCTDKCPGAAAGHWRAKR